MILFSPVLKKTITCIFFLYVIHLGISFHKLSNFTQLAKIKLIVCFVYALLLSKDSKNKIIRKTRVHLIFFNNVYYN